MNKLKIIFGLWVLIFSLDLFCQSGTYIRASCLIDDNKIKWTLSLNEDGTFLYRFYRDLAGERNPEENYYGKETWEKVEKIIIFSSKKR